MSRTRGRVTLPVQSIFSEDAKTFTERWGADVLRLDGNKAPVNTPNLWMLRSVQHTHP